MVDFRMSDGRWKRFNGPARITSLVRVTKIWKGSKIKWRRKKKKEVYDSLRGATFCRPVVGAVIVILSY